MTPFPPPTPFSEPTATPPNGNRRRLVIAAFAATALGVGGVVVGSTLAAADDETPADESTGETNEDEPITDDSDDQPVDDEPVADEHGDAPEDWPGLDELDNAFDEFDACLSEQLPDLSDGGWLDMDGGELPDLGDWGGEFDELLGGTVTVFAPGADGGDLSVLDFGDGDGSITITQSDGEITVVTDGDVGELDASLPDLDDFDFSELDLNDFQLPDLDLSDLELPDIGFELDPEVTSAVEACVSLLPDGGIFDMVGEFIDDVSNPAGDED